MTLLVTGSSGRVGRALHAAWASDAGPPMRVLWHGRTKAQNIDIAWHIGADSAPELPQGLIILHLAGVVRGSVAQLAENRLATTAVCKLALDRTARHVFVMSSVAVYRPTSGLITELDAPDPQSDYGLAKHQAEIAASSVLNGPNAPGLSLLRLANLAGADALLQSSDPGHSVALDPIAGQTSGPVRSYIGPRALASVLTSLIQMADQGVALPRLLNIAQPPAVAMGDLLAARGQPWHFGPSRPAAVARVAVSTDRLNALLPVPPATPASLIADLDGLRGRWP